MADPQQIAAALKFYESKKSIDPFGQQSIGERVMPALTNIYNSIQTVPERVSNFVQNPGQSLRDMVNEANTRAGAFNQAGSSALDEFLQTKSLTGPKQMEVAQTMADAYNPVGMFIGPNAASFNKITASKAQELEKLNKTPEEIWQQTGTFRGPDKQWRQEISDKGSKITEDVYNQISANKQFKGPMGQALQHEELYKAYPQASQIPTTMYADEAPSGSLLKGKSGTFQIPQLSVGGPSSMTQRSTSLHELQHAIQQREGFSPGGSPMLFSSQDTKELMNLSNKLLALSNNNDVSKAINYGLTGNSKALMELKKTMSPKDYQEAIDGYRLTKQYAKEGKVQLGDLKGMADELWQQAEALNPNNQYRRLAGEAEARATQKRRNLTEEQRKAIFPLESYDVPIKDLIFR